jgi:LmbE family N-acetylglucosaminyl deacetylase/SAM-dependent methyltransferase
MGVRFDHREPGTSEKEWADASPWQSAPALDLGVDRLLVLAAHPDDETLGAGALIAVAASRSIPVHVVCASDGDAAYPGTARAALAAERRRETLAAVELLAPVARVTFLGLPDGGLREHREELTDRVRAIIASESNGTTLVAAPWDGDGHRDHRILGEVANGMQSDTVRVVGYPIWLWHWGHPASEGDQNWRVLDVPREVAALKERAVACHRTQLESPAASAHEPPILPPQMRAHFARPVEVFIAKASTAGRADAAETGASDTSYFSGLYERHEDPWGFDVRWYERRKRDVLLSALPRERFARVLEIGCATGALTERLAERAEAVVGIDAVDAAVTRSRARLGDNPHIDVRQMTIPRDWPEGAFDLVVLSEIGYYLTDDALSETLDRIEASLSDDGILVACHWRHPIAEAALSTDDVHAAIAARDAWKAQVTHLERDFRLEVYARRGTPSVAQQNGLAP